MNLQGRALSLEMIGDDVKLLHSVLRRLGYEIKDHEVQEKFFGESTRDAVKTFQEKNHLETTGVVDETTAKHINAEIEARKEWIVRGQVRQPDGKPLAGLVVKAYDKDMRSEELLGQATTDKEGRYEIKYTAEQFSRVEKGSADLRISVGNSDGLEIFSTKEIRFNAQPVETIDLTVGGDYRCPSEFDQLINEIAPLLQGVPLHELREDEKYQDISFLAGETGLDRQRIAWLVKAAKLAHETRLPTETAPGIKTNVGMGIPETSSIPAEVFYGFFRQNLPTGLPEILKQTTDTLRLALEDSLRDNIIPTSIREHIDQVLQKLLPAL